MNFNATNHYFPILEDLSTAVLQTTSKEQLLQRIADLGVLALKGWCCTIVTIDQESRNLTIEAIGYADIPFRVTVTPEGLSVHGKLIASEDFMHSRTIEFQETLNTEQKNRTLFKNWQQTRYRVLGKPLISANQLLGYICFILPASNPLTTEAINVINVFITTSVMVLERAEYDLILGRASKILVSLTKELSTVTPHAFFDKVVLDVCNLLNIPVCIVWTTDRHAKTLSVCSYSGNVDDAFKNITLDVDSPGVRRLLQRSAVATLLDVRDQASYYSHGKEAAERGWVSLLSAPMYIEGRLMGIIDAYTTYPRNFSGWERDFFGIFASTSALSLWHHETHNNLKALNDAMKNMTQAESVEDVLEIVLTEGLRILRTPRGNVYRLNLETGNLSNVIQHGNPDYAPNMNVDKGIIGKALREGKLVRANDVRESEWAEFYVPLWHNSLSELAIPIIIPNAPIRVGHEVQTAKRPLGVVNFESPFVDAFSQSDAEVLSSLVSQAATIIDRFEFDTKISELREFERKIVGKRDWDSTIQIILEGITTVLGYDHVNLSLIEEQRIRTKYVVGIPEHLKAKFISKADHALSSKDIQSHVVRHREVIVPDPDDWRFDPEIYEMFGHKDLIRVFVPMISPDNRVLGTIETGHRRGYRTHIYERDIHLLKNFVDYAVQALSLRSAEQIEKIMHELRAPIDGIRSNADYLQRHYNRLTVEKIQRKLEDFLTDTAILLLQVGDLEHIFGRPPIAGQRKHTIVFRDIIIKALNQLRALMIERDFDPDTIYYRSSDIHRIRIYVDRAKLSQVVLNLLLNAIKYAEDNPAKFSLRVLVEDDRKNFFIKFQDMGIGIRQGLEEAIFDDGYRTDEAIKRDPNGSGLGLTIAKKILKEMGGDLKLTNNYRPTEFEITLPKALKERPDDPTR